MLGTHVINVIMYNILKVINVMHHPYHSIKPLYVITVLVLKLFHLTGVWLFLLSFLFNLQGFSYPTLLLFAYLYIFL